MNLLIAGSLELSLGLLLNIFIFLGEEVGWRGFLYPKLLTLYGKRGLIYGGIVWGLWHTPMIYFYDANFGTHHNVGLLFMIVFCILAGIILQYIYQQSQSIFSVALMHGMLNKAGGFIVTFSVPGEYRYFIDGTTGVVGISMLLIIAVFCYVSFPINREIG